MNRRALVLAIAGASLVMMGCSSAGDPPSSPTSAPATAAAPLSLVVIGDSIPYNGQEDCPNCKGFVTQYANALAKATGREVTTKNRSEHTGLTLPDIKVDAACAAQATKTYRPVYDELFATVSGWRTGKPTILLTVNRYNDWIGFEQADLTPEQADQTVILHDAWNTMLCDSAEANNFDCTDVYHAFTGADGSKPSADLLAADYTHPSQLGNDEITELLTQRGFEPLG